MVKKPKQGPYVITGNAPEEESDMEKAIRAAKEAVTAINRFTPKELADAGALPDLIHLNDLTESLADDVTERFGGVYTS